MIKTTINEIIKKIELINSKQIEILSHNKDENFNIYNSLSFSKSKENDF